MILLINLPSPFLISDKVYPPLGLRYITSCFEQIGKEVYALDLAGKAVNFENFPEQSFEFIGISAVTAQAPLAIKAMRLCRDLYVETPVGIGGIHATLKPKDFALFDYVIQGEGERAVLDIASWMGSGKQQISYAFNGELDWLPIPSFDHFCDSYSANLYGRRAMTVVATRGCPYDCAFCSDIFGKTLRKRSPGHVLTEINQGIAQGYEAIIFYDDCLILDKRWFWELAAMLMDVSLPYRCNVRANLIDMNVVKVLSNSGCQLVCFGAESGSQYILDTIRKHTAVEENTAMVLLAREYGVKVKAYLMLGTPKETEETVEETYRWLEQARPDEFQVSLYTPFPKTALVDTFNIKLPAYDQLYYKGTDNHIERSYCKLSPKRLMYWMTKMEALRCSQ